MQHQPLSSEHRCEQSDECQCEQSERQSEHHHESTVNTQSAMFTVVNSDEKMTRRLCRTLGIPYKQRSELNSVIIPNDRRQRRKERSLLTQFNQHLKPIITIQRWWRHQHPLYVNDTDFSTLEEFVPNQTFFCLIESTGHIYRFNPITLAKYFTEFGLFINPYTRHDLNRIELHRLDCHLQKCDPPHPVNMCNTYISISLQRSQEREHERSCQFLHNECINLITRVGRLVTMTNIFPLHIILNELTLEVLPNYFDTFRQLFLLDSDFSCESVMYVATTLCRMTNNIEHVCTREKLFILKTTIGILNDFISIVLPSLPALLQSEMEEVNDEADESADTR